MLLKFTQFDLNFLNFKYFKFFLLCFENPFKENFVLTKKLGLSLFVVLLMLSLLLVVLLLLLILLLLVAVKSCSDSEQFRKLSQIVCDSLMLSLENCTRLMLFVDELFELLLSKALSKIKKNLEKKI